LWFRCILICVIGVYDIQKKKKKKDESEYNRECLFKHVILILDEREEEEKMSEKKKRKLSIRKHICVTGIIVQGFDEGFLFVLLFQGENQLFKNNQIIIEYINFIPMIWIN
jgi:hypothetical protein